MATGNQKVKSNMHKIPRSIMRQFRPNDISKEKWERKIDKMHSSKNLIKESHLKWLDRIYHAFEKQIPKIIEIIQNKNNDEFKLEGHVNKNFDKTKYSPPYDQWFENLTFDQKFTGVLISHMIGDMIINSESRFASILELLVIGCFVRSFIDSPKNYELENLKKEWFHINSFINAMTPVEIICTDEPREIDHIDNIITWKKIVENDGGFGFLRQTPYLMICIRLSKRITLVAYLREFWKMPFATGITYHWDHIYHPRIKREK